MWKMLRLFHGTWRRNIQFQWGKVGYLPRDNWLHNVEDKPFGSNFIKTERKDRYNSYIKIDLLSKFEFCQSVKQLNQSKHKQDRNCYNGLNINLSGTVY